MKKLTLELNLDDLNVDSFATDASDAERGTVRGQALDLTDGCQTPIIDCDPFTDDDPGCPILLTADPSCADPCFPGTDVGCQLI